MIFIHEGECYIDIPEINACEGCFFEHIDSCDFVYDEVPEQIACGLTPVIYAKHCKEIELI